MSCSYIKYTAGILIWRIKQNSLLLLHPCILKQSTCYTITPDTCQRYRINTNEITNIHRITLCNDLTVHMEPLPPTEPLE